MFLGRYSMYKMYALLIVEKSRQAEVVCSTVDNNSLSEVGLSAKRSSPASFPKRLLTPACTAAHSNPRSVLGT